MNDSKQTYQHIHEAFMSVVNEQNSVSDERKERLIKDIMSGEPPEYSPSGRRAGPTQVRNVDDETVRAPEGLHTALDVGGMVPGVGVFADLINAGIYAEEGRPGMAGLALAAAIPGAGLAVGGAKLAKGASKLGAGASSKALKHTEKAKDIMTRAGADVPADAPLQRSIDALTDLQTKRGFRGTDRAARIAAKETPEAIRTASETAAQALARGARSGGHRAVTGVGRGTWRRMPDAAQQQVLRNLSDAQKFAQQGATRTQRLLDPDKLLYSKRLFSVPGAATRTALIGAGEAEAQGYGEEGPFSDIATGVSKGVSKGVEQAKLTWAELEKLIKAGGYHTGNYGYGN